MALNDNTDDKKNCWLTEFAHPIALPRVAVLDREDEVYHFYNVITSATGASG